MSTPPLSPEELAAYLAAIVQSSDDAIVGKTLDGIITSWNPSAEKLFGHGAAEAIGRHITLIVPPERLAEEDEVIRRLRAGETIDHFETVRITKGGERIPISLTVSPVRTSDGRIIGASKVVRDLRDRRQAEVIRARLAAIVDSSEDAIVSKTLEGVITSWNQGAERLFGYTALEAIGRHITLIIPADRRAEEDDVLAKIRRGEALRSFETVRVRKDGRLIDISLTVSPVRDAAGTIIGASKIARDITERKRIEAERERLLAQEQAARSEAEAVNRGKDQFLAVLSHELRTPLNAIYGWARMLYDDTIGADLRRRAVDAIFRNARAQLQLVEDLIDMSRIITGNMRLDVGPVDLAAVIEAALDTVRPAAVAKEIRLEARLESPDVTISGAADRLQQVVWNLLINAVKFTPRGGRVEIELRRGDADVEIVVSDTGEGIAADLLPHVFERFRQGDSSSTRAHGGLGLGLALVRHLVDLHGGTVRAESPGPGRGATFTVALPLGDVQPAQALPAPPGQATLTSLAGIRVLLVDDDADSLELARVILSSAGAEARAATSAAAARARLNGWLADVFLLDLEMPGEDGYTLLQHLRERDQFRGTPAIALTAYGRGEDRRRALAAGFTLYLSKPVDPAELTRAVSNVARRSA
jgi:PAS domain S-box-containing protein